MINYTKPRRSYEIIRETVCGIPRGKVATYGQIAELCGLPRQARLVGYALYTLPPGSGVPWHRVINAQGGISVSDLDGKCEEQVRLLRKEGIAVIGEKVDLGRYRWRGHSPRTPR